MRFGIMAMQIGALIPNDVAPSQIPAHIAGFDHAALVRRLHEHGFNPVELGGDLVMFMPHLYAPPAIEALAALQAETGVSYTVHLPLWSVEPSALLEPIRRGSVESMAQVVRATQGLDVEAYVVHATGSLAAEFYRMSLPEMGRQVILKLFQGRALESLKALAGETGVAPRKLAVETIEFPFENDEDVEIDHNVCTGTVSIPKYAGGAVPARGRTFHIHHNWFRDSYAIEFVRNGVEIDHNLFDFDVQKDHGNLISGFGKAVAPGPASFHNNLVSNPGRGVIWINEVFNHLEIRNNHIITRTTVTPREDGLFGFNPGCDFTTITIRDNVIECQGQARPLLRCDESYGAVIRNNRLTDLSDTARYENPSTGEHAGLEAPRKFECGVHGEVTVDGWKATGPKHRKAVFGGSLMKPLPIGIGLLLQGSSLLLSDRNDIRAGNEAAWWRRLVHNRE